MGREAGSGTRDGFESIVDVKDSCKYAQELTATGAVISAVEANPLAIGYASLSAVGDTVAMVTVEGVECSEDTVKDSSYKIQRPFVFVTNKSVTLSEQAQAFVDFATSKDAADLIRTAGAVPVNAFCVAILHAKGLVFFGLVWVCAASSAMAVLERKQNP